MLRSDFEYNGHRLSDFQMSMFDPSDQTSFVGREIARTELTSRNQSSHFYTTYHKELLTIPFLIIKDPNLIGSPSEYVLTDKQIHVLRSWLTSPTTAIELKPATDDEEVNVSYFGVFTEVQPYIVNERCMGLYLTFTCNSPYGYSPITSKRYTIDADSITNDFINNAVQFAECIMPTIIIRANRLSSFHGEELTITNSSDGDKKMNIKLLEGLSEIKIDCQKKIVTDQDGKLLALSDIGMTPNEFKDDDVRLVQTYSIYWLNLVRGNNKLKFETSNRVSSYTVEIQTRYIIKGGAF